MPADSWAVSTMSDLNESHVALARITDALFCSDLEVGDMPSGHRLAVAVQHSLKAHRLHPKPHCSRRA
jgi:hypothetical protein